MIRLGFARAPAVSICICIFGGLRMIERFCPLKFRRSTHLSVRADMGVGVLHTGQVCGCVRVGGCVSCPIDLCAELLCSRNSSHYSHHMSECWTCCFASHWRKKRKKNFLSCIPQPSPQSARSWLFWCQRWLQRSLSLSNVMSQGRNLESISIFFNTGFRCGSSPARAPADEC